MEFRDGAECRSLVRAQRFQTADIFHPTIQLSLFISYRRLTQIPILKNVVSICFKFLCAKYRNKSCQTLHLVFFPKIFNLFKRDKILKKKKQEQNRKKKNIHKTLS
uniref:Uncharacterized protein n=1 Tax=Micrurus spixii TaxID=129469 RepID=A0A2D4LDU9_9SAUR